MISHLPPRPVYRHPFLNPSTLTIPLSPDLDIHLKPPDKLL
jgi:hypothetical protein